MLEMITLISSPDWSLEYIHSTFSCTFFCQLVTGVFLFYFLFYIDVQWCWVLPSNCSTHAGDSSIPVCGNCYFKHNTQAALSHLLFVPLSVSRSLTCSKKTTVIVHKVSPFFCAATADNMPFPIKAFHNFVNYLRQVLNSVNPAKSQPGSAMSTAITEHRSVFC